MADPANPAKPTKSSSSQIRPTPQLPAKPVPPRGTYVIQVPKDQVYRVPPPENAILFEKLSRRKQRRSPCCCCLCWLVGLLAALILLAGIAGLVLYLVFQPEKPEYSVESVAINGFNLTSSAPISPEFDVTIRANNPNDKLGIYYQEGSAVKVYYNGSMFCYGELPIFYQGTNNVTVFMTALKGSGLELASAARNALVEEQSRGTVPFTLKFRTPVKIKVGSIKTWTITVKVDCDVTVDKLTTNAKVLSRKCHHGVDFW